MKGQRTIGLVVVGLMACSAEAVTPGDPTPIAGAGEYSEETGSEWDPQTALSALKSGKAELHYLGEIKVGEQWVDPGGAGTISVEAQAALLTAAAFKALPHQAVPFDVGHSESLMMVALAFTGADDRTWLRPGLRPGVSLDDLSGSDEPMAPTPIVIAGKKKEGDGFDPNSEFDTTDYPPGSVQQHSDLPDEDVGGTDADADADADQWDPTQDTNTTTEDDKWGTEDFEVDDDMQQEIDDMEDQLDEQRKKPH